MKLTEREKIAHLLRRFGLGGSEAELDYYGQNGINGAIDKLLNYTQHKDVFDFNPMEFANKQGTVNLRVMQGLWAAKLICTERPLEEKMTLFWHHHFATSSTKVENSFVMNNHISCLRTNATGKFLDLILAVSKDPGMLYWLDNQSNIAGKPNENFAREVMELFTLGIGKYTEEDVQEAARAFTGWGYGFERQNGRVLLNEKAPRRVDQFIFTQQRHDDGPKTILGKTGPFNGDDVLALLCENPQTSRYLVFKIWEFFCYPNPEPGLVEKFAAKFRASGLDIKQLLQSIMTSEEFYSEKCVRRLVKSPIDFVVPIARQTGVGAQMIARIKTGIANPQINEETGLNIRLVGAIGPGFAVLTAATSMGMELMSPPDVAGWKLHDNWITTSTILDRVKWAERVFFGGNTGPSQNIGGGGRGRAPSLNVNPMGILAGARTPAATVDALLSLFDQTLPESKRKVLVDAAQNAAAQVIEQSPNGQNRGGGFLQRANSQGSNAGTVTAANASLVARTVCKLLFGSPEFQAC